MWCEYTYLYVQYRGEVNDSTVEGVVVVVVEDLVSIFWINMCVQFCFTTPHNKEKKHLNI